MYIVHVCLEKVTLIWCYILRENYANIGKPMEGLPILACGVPLNERLLRYNKVDLEQWFTPTNLLEKVPAVGCVIDLTDTNRYYDPKVFRDSNVQYAKIYCRGHTIPNPQTIQRFFSVMDNFLRDPQSQGRIVVVHCTHGVNRTGFMVAMYLVVRRGYQPADAISGFNTARGYPIERQNYIQNLHQLIPRVCPYPVPLPLFQERDRQCGSTVAKYQQNETLKTKSNPSSTLTTKKHSDVRGKALMAKPNGKANKEDDNPEKKPKNLVVSKMRTKPKSASNSVQNSSIPATNQPFYSSSTSNCVTEKVHSYPVPLPLFQERDRQCGSTVAKYQQNETLKTKSNPSSTSTTKKHSDVRGKALAKPNGKANKEDDNAEKKPKNLVVSKMRTKPKSASNSVELSSLPATD